MSRLDVDVLQSISNPHIKIPLSYIYNLIGFPRWKHMNIPYSVGQIVYDDGLLWQSLANGNEAVPRNDDGLKWRKILVSELSELSDINNVNNSISELNNTVDTLVADSSEITSNLTDIIIALDGEGENGGALARLEDTITLLEDVQNRLARLELIISPTESE